ncbi:hypothetical protein ACNSO7_27030 [Yersinia enterocolitica]|uniref:hypothetical protein n=1 Tax=Yersinia enterocolitica TaxID=630 RepID=UPI003AB12407
MNFLDDILCRSTDMDVETYRMKREADEKIMKEAEVYHNLSPEQWPELIFNWDVSHESQIYSTDEHKIDSFNTNYPNGFILGYVQLDVFDKRLCAFSRRDSVEELWSTGFPSRLAFLIAYLSHGYPISPPIARADPFSKLDVRLDGGHHRYAVAKFCCQPKQTILPIYIRPEDKDKIQKRVEIDWRY